MDVSNLLAFAFKKKFENKGSQMGHTKKTKNIFSYYTKQFLNYKSVQLKYSCDTLDNCVATPGLKHTALD